jgi:hypothetical protein
VVVVMLLTGGGIEGKRALILFCLPGCFYRRERVLSVILFYQVWGMNLVSWFPCVVAVQISFPFDKVVELLCSPLASVTDDAPNEESTDIR